MVSTDPAAPIAATRPARRQHHGDLFSDDFAWMRNKEDPEFLEYLRAENAYTDAMTHHLASLEEQIYGEIVARIQETDLSVPEFVRHSDGSTWWYYSRTTEGLQYERHCRLRASDPDDIPDVTVAPSDEQVLLDENVLADGSDYFALGLCDVSPDGTRLAYSVDTQGDERYQLRVIDLADRSVLTEVDEVGAGGCWSSDQAVVYTRVDAAWRPFQVWRQELDQSAPPRLIHQEPDDRFWATVEESRDRDWVVIRLDSKDTSECLLTAAADSEAKVRVVSPRRPGIECDVEVGVDALYLVHNDGASEFCLARASFEAAGPADWEVLIPGRPDVRLLGVAAYRGWLVLSLRQGGLPAIEVIPLLADGALGEAWRVEVEEELFSLSAAGSDNPDADRIRLVYQSMVTPPRIEELRLDDRSRRILKTTPVLDEPTFGPYRPDDYVQRREWARAPDGTRVPISLVHRRGLVLDGSAPALLYGYGAYETSLPDRFSIVRLSLLDRGFVFAIAHVRGGGELGRRWYTDGRLAAKSNSFDDFVACARHLVGAHFTRADRLVGEGGSAGGLLIGAAVNLAPDAFAAIHADVPFVDALTTILDPSLPLTVTEWDEWGDPLHDPAAYATMKSYTPYENVRATDYPAILVTASLNDTRVEITEPAKWVAQLRRTVTSADRRPILFRIELAAGHAGVSGRYQAWRDAAFEVAWMIDQVGDLPEREQPQS